MTISKTQIFNIVLNILGVSNPLENTNSSNSRTVLLNNYYELARDYVLKDFDWNFASTFCELALYENQEDITVLNNFKYAYYYPNDCLLARDVFEKNSYVIQKYMVTSSQNLQKIILTDTQNAVLRYTRRVDKEVYFSCEYAMALSYYLASLTASVIVGSLQKGQMAYEKYVKILKHAKMLNAQEGLEQVYDENTYLDSRY